MSKPKQAGGRPRDSRVDHAIATAVRSLLDEHGYAALTVDAVAARAGVGKAAIYRRHSTKQEMIFAVLLHDLDEEPPGDTGSLHGDIAALTRRIADQLAQAAAEVMVGLLADIHADASLDARFSGAYLAVERSSIGTLLDRAVARGELPVRPDPVLVHVLLLGPLFAWQLMLNEDSARTPQLAEMVARIVTEALTSGAVSPEAR
ncbi:TetR/AcrR family transcriptional regulator [Nocardia uniformis]|uniref:TetR/AcrR family transcriptional regulator n=1 Tax=Nocardia uniformis TaxID=53432 RepID=A0A849C144_9NOCA|nr:TetR/AcrR family transcriptional regulator [Nocardia uniformis]NNH70210.1 TetR/AcrR family transcriptional regulator [Nocardia uniformis]